MQLLWTKQCKSPNRSSWHVLNLSFASSPEQCLVAQEILPSLLQVVKQPLRAVAQHLFTPQEKKSLALVVANLVAYALTFDLGQQQQYGMPEDAKAFASGVTPLTPAVHTLCTYPVRHYALPHRSDIIRWLCSCG